MSAASQAGPRAGRALRRLPPVRFLERHVPAQLHVVSALVLAEVVVVVLVGLAPSTVPFTSLMVPLLVGSLFLGPRQAPWFVGAVLVLLGVALLLQDDLTPRVLGAAGIQVVMCLVVLAASVRRNRLGVDPGTGESMFVDLRDRILDQAGMPELPPGWHAESALRSSGGTPFAGDFVVAARPLDSRLDLVLVDVSGKGEKAGTRALQLSGALGALLGALPPEGFLPAANDYLVRQDWAEGFATAVHLTVDLGSGRYEVRTAGHPPAVLRHAGSGRWSVLESSGPVLGLIPGSDFLPATGVLARGDAVVLFTDGMVEEPTLDIDLGIDRLLGEAEQLLRGSFEGAAARLVDALGSRDDDRALLLVTRT